MDIATDILEEYDEDSRFTIEYEIYPHYIKFSAIKDESSSDIPEVEGHLKWDGCMNVTADSHYCRLQHANEYLMLITAVYKKGLDVMPKADYEMNE